MDKKRIKGYDRVMPRVYNNSRASLMSNSVVTRHEVPSSVCVGAKPSVSCVSYSVFSELPTVLNDYVPEESVKNVESCVRMSKVVKPRRTLKSLDTSKSPPRTVTKHRTIPRVLRAEKSTPVLKGDEEWSESHVRQCYSSRSHTRLKELKDEIKAYHETEKFMRWRSHIYKTCGVVFDEDGNIAADKAVQAELEKEKEPKQSSDCKVHWNRLRNAYIHAVSRRKQPKRPLNKWKFADEMEFLRPFMLPKYKPPIEDNSNENTNQAAAVISDTSDSDSVHLGNVTDSPQSKQSDDDDNIRPELVLLGNVKELPQNEQSDDNLSPGLVLEIMKHLKQEKDELDLFFEYMARTVKNMPKLEQVLLKRAIFKLVSDAELRLLETEENRERLQNDQNFVTYPQVTQSKSETDLL